MIRNVDMDDAPAIVRQEDQHKQHSAGERRHGEEVHRRGRREVTRQKSPPRLRRWPRLPFQQTRHGAF